MAENDWLCLSANYRLRRSGQHPNPLIDTKRLIAWVRENDTELGADTTSIFLVGCSAGAHLAVSAALTPNVSEFQAGFADTDTSVAGVIALYGYLGPRTADPSSSPTRLAASDAPPMLIIHGANDTAIPASDSRAVAATLSRASENPVVFVELPHTQHSFDRFASVRSRAVADTSASFLDWAREYARRGERL
nr:alpha/beta hydrolase [Nakamurella aerolata]